MSPSAEPPARPFRVVVADDTPGIRLLMRHILEGSGAFEVVADAADGQQAVELATALQPDLVLLDLVMPKLDGLEAIPRIRSASPSSRIVVLSGFTAQGMATRASGEGADGYVEKRQSPSEILRVALDVCRSTGPRAEAGGAPWATSPPGAEAPDAAEASTWEEAPGQTPPDASQPSLEGPEAVLASTVQALARARADLAAIGSAAAHDLKSPLQAISGFAHLLDQLYTAALDDRGRMFTRTIIEATDRMASMVDGLAIYCRMLSTRPEPAQVKLDDVLAAVLQKLEADITSSGASIVSRPLPEAVADPTQIAVVLTSLLTNALTWVEAGRTPQVTISSEPTPGGWSIAVEDNGVGIEAEQAERVFGLFAGLPSGAGKPGAGVGLALARRIVEGWGGTIWVEATGQGGSRFCFTVPDHLGVPHYPAAKVFVVGESRAAPGRPGAADAAALVEGDQGAGLLARDVQQLLLVEDSEPHARLVAATLAESPGPRYRLRHVVDLRHARKALAEQRIDCILLDLSLPDGEGLDSLAQMRAMAPSIPVVVLTSRSDESLAVTAVQQGAQDYLVKGAMEPRTLGRSIRYAIERKALEAQLAQQALHDSLTGLPNRVLLLDRLNPALARAGRSGEKIALLYLDLDGFKPINDDLGHEAGDGILVEVARRLTSVVRPQDTVARMGGDEFAVLCEGFRGDAEIQALAGRMAEAISQPVSVGNQTRSVRASIGIAFAGGPGESADDLIRMADQAMYRDKRRGSSPDGAPAST